MHSFRYLLAYTIISVQAFFLMGCDDHYVRPSSSDREIITIRNETGRIIGTVEGDGTIRNKVGRIIGTIN